MKYRGIISFDLDGTLITTNYEAKKCYLNAFNKTFKIDDFNIPDFKGGVDLAILKRLCDENGIKLNKNKIKLFIKEYLDELYNNTNPSNWSVFEYVFEFIEFIKNLGFYTVLVSGNYYETGSYKLIKTSLNNSFSFLSLNKYEKSRIELMLKALRYAKEKKMKIFAHIGDAFSDITTSHYFNIPAFLFLPDANFSEKTNWNEILINSLKINDLSYFSKNVKNIFDINSFQFIKTENFISKATKPKKNNVVLIFNSYMILTRNFENILKSNILNNGG